MINEQLPSQQTVPSPTKSDRKIRRIEDVTGKFTIEEVAEDVRKHKLDARNLEQYLSEEDKEREKLEWIKTSWAAIDKAFRETVGHEIPPFDPEMFNLFVTEESDILQKGAQYTNSGLIAINVNLPSVEILSTVIHELLHFISIRLMLTNFEHKKNMRHGFSITASMIDEAPKDVKRRGWSKRYITKESFEKNDISLVALDEAILELTAVKIFKVAAAELKFDFIQINTQVNSTYRGTREFMDLLIANLVTAYNNPDVEKSVRSQSLKDYRLVSKPSKKNISDEIYTFEDVKKERNRIGRIQEIVRSVMDRNKGDDRFREIKEKFSWGDEITVEQFEKIFEQSLFDKKILPDLTFLINRFIGVKTFQKLHELTVNLSPHAFENRTGFQDTMKVEELRRTVNLPLREFKKRPLDLFVKFSNNITFYLSAEKIAAANARNIENRKDSQQELDVFLPEDVLNRYIYLLEKPLDEKQQETALSMMVESINGRVPDHWISSVLHVQSRTYKGPESLDSVLALCFDEMMTKMKVIPQDPTFESKMINGLNCDVKKQIWRPQKFKNDMVQVTIDAPEIARSAQVIFWYVAERAPHV